MKPTTFDLCDLADETPAVATSPASDAPPWEEQAAELREWAAGAIERPPAPAIIIDIETGPRPWEEIERFFQPPDQPGEFDPGSVKYGNLKDTTKRAEKLAAAEAAHALLVANWQATVDAAKEEFIGRAALSPITGRVLLIGALDFGGEASYFFNDSEAALLEQFWLHVDQWLAAKLPIIGHNSAAFDIPFLVRRSWALGVPVPREVRLGRYWHPLFRDTMEWWGCGARENVKLNVLGDFFGVGQKTEGVNGGDFAKLWFGQMPAETWGSADEQRLKALEYNGRDLQLTAAIAAKMGMV